MVYIILINYNSFQDTFECISSILNSDYKRYKIILIDNNSGDDSLIKLKNSFPSIEYILNDTNIGFSGGCNQGIKYALEKGAEYILLLNNDTAVHPMMLHNLMSRIDDDTGLATGRILFFNNPTKIWYDGAKLHYYSLEGKFYNYNTNVNQVQTKKENEVSFITGCFMLISRDTIHRVGLLDERLFAQYEDLDYCIRAAKCSVKFSYIPEAIIWHKVSSSFGSGKSIIKYKPLTYYLKSRNKLILIKKHKRGPSFYAALIRTLPKYLKYFLGFLLLLRFDEFRQSLAGVRDGILLKI